MNLKRTISECNDTHHVQSYLCPLTKRIAFAQFYSIPSPLFSTTSSIHYTREKYLKHPTNFRPFRRTKMLAGTSFLCNVVQHLASRCVKRLLFVTASLSCKHRLRYLSKISLAKQRKFSSLQEASKNRVLPFAMRAALRGEHFAYTNAPSFFHMLHIHSFHSPSLTTLRISVH